MKTLPSWFKKKVPSNARYEKVVNLLNDLELTTVCKEAKCPNVGECYSRGTATFMILGDVCTRNCRFCAITLGKPRKVDSDEPRRLRQAIQHLELDHVVITMVTRDDLKDGGSGHFVNVIREVKEHTNVTIEVLTSDFRGRRESVEEVVCAGPDVFNHNMETTESLHKKVRPMMAYDRSLDVLEHAKKVRPEIILKSGFMLGLGEEKEEIERLLKDLRKVGCEFVTIGQYLRPPGSTLKVENFVSPQEFKEWGTYAKELGFRLVESSPLVRSSYKADQAMLHMSMS
ncbi:lipoyl synthase [PVC group bacterium (ex Bugula neritina AB1)]|nr:lipoyl synthase [PVC group bacterium (ex Bugula neritina AB1)]